MDRNRATKAIWGVNSTQYGNQAAWENPANRYHSGCETWGTIENCVGVSGDLMFDLQGTATRE